MNYTEKFVAYVDILGFKELVRRSEEGGEGAPTLDYVLQLTRLFGSVNDEDFAKYGPTTCPCAPCIARDLNFRLTQASDGVVISSEISPAGLINLVAHCYKTMVRFLEVGHLCRGYLTRGNLAHEGVNFIGTGFHRAFENEKSVSTFQIDLSDKGTPFIEIDPAVCGYVSEQTDSCVKTIFGRLTESDGQSTAITPFYFFRMMPSMPLDNPVAYKEQVRFVCDVVLRLLARLEEAEATAPAAGRRKIEHHKRKLREVLALKDKQLEAMDGLSQPFPRRW